MIPKLRDICYEMRLRECGYENIDNNICSRLKKREGLNDMKLH